MEDNNEKDETHILRLKKHVWTDEALAKEKKHVKRLRIWIIVCLIFGIGLGWFGGSILPLPKTGSIRNSTGTSLSSSDKIATVRNILEKEWYFGQDIEDLDTRLTDQALYGMTNNSEDIHTSYMSAEEMNAFTQSINRNFTGIGVEYIAVNHLNMVTRVFKNSPAEKAGVQPGDRMVSVDGTDVSDKTADEIKELVTGEAGTVVSITFERNGKPISLDITRAEVTATAYGKVLDDGTGYLQLYQFGQSTGDEVKAYLDDFHAQGVTNLVLDLRDNGGGYLEALQKVASYFLPDDTVVMQQVYTDGSTTQTKTLGSEDTDIDQIVILVNENTASAAEVMTLALRENRGAKVIGTTTYGKGSVQVSKVFSDGSAIKYTTSKWISSQGVWINGTGITPDETVKLDDVFYITFAGMEEGTTVGVDEVSDAVKDAQMALKYLGYEPDREDGYFSPATLAALQSYEHDNNMTVSDALDQSIYMAIVGSVRMRWATTTDTDTQLNRACELLNS